MSELSLVSRASVPDRGGSEVESARFHTKVAGAGGVRGVPLQDGDHMIGTTLAHFKITGKLGEGGMGEVYRAQDTKLGREVALKVLPELFAQDHERMTRFAREAQVLASLNHTNIAAIYSLESAEATGESTDRDPEAAGLRAGRSGEVNFLVMEIVEGETLQERIARGAVSLEEGARIGLQIAQAMEVAHEKGIVHRDLKPANVKINPDGQVKVLDFGLAKALEEEADPADIANSPTLTAAATQAGIIMGTAAYMSPEQAAGSVADRRADIWSYGVVLSEMLTGRQQFGGETVSHTLASVLKDEPEWDRFPKHVPSRVVDLLQRCLRKDAKQRLQAIGEARVLWEEYLADPQAFEVAAEAAAIGFDAVPAWKRLLPWGVAATLALALGFVALQWSNLAKQPPSLLRTSILPPEGHDWYLNPTRPGRVNISPDGSQLVYSAIAEGESTPSLWVRPLDSPVGRPLSNTEGAGYPFWSPDGRHIGFFTNDKLKKIAVGGGPPVSLCDAQNGKSGSWNKDGMIVFSPEPTSSLSRVPAAGGDCVAITVLSEEIGEISHRHPVFLPDGDHFLYLARRSGPNVLRVGSLDGETSQDLLETPTNADFADGRLLFYREGTLMAQPFDPVGLELSGEAVPLIEEVLEIPGASASVFSVSEIGSLVYQTGQSTLNSQLVWRDRTGADLGDLGEPVDQASIALSTDGTWGAANIDSEEGHDDIWLYETGRGLRTRFTFSPGNEVSPSFSPDGTRVAFSSDRESTTYNLYIKEVGGTGEAELLFASEDRVFPYSWTPDGMTILFVALKGGANDLYALPVDGERVPIPLIESEFREGDPIVSPDGRWLAYSSSESGEREIYVTTFPNAERKWQVSVGGGRQPRWTRDGSEIVYISGNWDALMAAEVDPTGQTFKVGSNTKLFDVNLRPDLGRDWDVTADGERFILNPSPDRGRVSPLHHVTNWPAILENQ